MPKDRTVYSYYQKAFNIAPLDRSLAEIPLDSGRGKDCKRIIDAAKAFMRVCKSVSGESETTNITLFHSVQEHIDLLRNG